jgi:GT2 family glycosyltransferase
MDDDFVLEQSDLLERFVEELEYWPYDIVAGKLLRTDGREQHYEGWMVRDGDTLLLLRIESEEQTIPVEIVLNFFIARVDVLRKVPWDAAQKIIEHEDFFWRCKQAGVSVGYCPRLSMVHPEGAGDPFYKRHRNARVVHFREQVFAKHGWKDIVWRAL